ARQDPAAQLRRRRVRRPRRGRLHRRRRPRHGRGVRLGPPVHGTRRRRRVRRRAGGVRGVEAHHPGRAAGRAAGDGRHRRAGGRAAGGGRGAQHRQAGRAHHQRGDPADGGPDPLLRRGGADSGGALVGRVHAGLPVEHPARARRRRRVGDAVELPDDDGGLEVRSRARRRQHDRPQAQRHHPRQHGADGRAVLRHPAARGVQRRLRRPVHRRAPGRPPHTGDGVDHRQHPGGQGRGHGGRAERHAHPPGAGRQGAVRRVRRRRPGRRGRGDRRRRLLQRRAGLHRRHPRARALLGGRRPGGGARRAGGGRAAVPRRGRLGRPVHPPGEQPHPARARLRAGGARARARLGRHRRRPRPRLGVLLHAHDRRRPARRRRARPHGDLRAGDHGPDLRRRGRGGAAGQRHRLRARGERVDVVAHDGAAGLGRDRRGLRVGQLPHPAGRGDAARRVQAVGLRQGPVGVLAGGLHARQARHVVRRGM
ncbi:MAG: 4-aminobutyraldehyde dehydrogenase, partial [uncultured Pseudonocardia sp.]